MMKKRYAVIIAAAMMTGVMTATALAEGPGMDGSQQMSGPQMPGGNEMGQPPQMNGEAPQFNGDEQMPEMNGEAPQMNENSQPPQMDGQQPPQGEAPADSGNGQAPEMNGEAPQGEAPAENGNGQAPGMIGEAPEGNFGFIEFSNYVDDGTISQETYDAITKYMEENKPELPEGAVEGERPEFPEGAVEGERPELPEMKEGEGPNLLKDLLEAGVITQEEYDALAAAREADRPAMPAANQNNDSTQTTDESTGA